MIRPARYYVKSGDGAVECRLCPSQCRLTEGKAGICETRRNVGGELVTENYGELVTIALDPIEKKPLYHFYPGREIVSTGPNGCNLACEFCQNWSISQTKIKTAYMSPEELVQTSLRYDSIGIAFTYTEPLIWYEYLLDTAPLAHEHGLKVVLVTNGYLNPEPLEELLPLVDAMNVDLKAIRPEFYRDICKGKLGPVKENLKVIFKAGVHLEITNLIIPGHNDSDEELRELVDFVASISDRIPTHFSAYHPGYKFSAPRTPASTMRRAQKIASDKLKFVYLGNVTLETGSNTYCPACGELLIERIGYGTSIVGLNGSRCVGCGNETGIIQ